MISHLVDVYCRLGGIRSAPDLHPNRTPISLSWFARRGSLRAPQQRIAGDHLDTACPPHVRAELTNGRSVTPPSAHDLCFEQLGRFDRCARNNSGKGLIVIGGQKKRKIPTRRDAVMRSRSRHELTGTRAARLKYLRDVLDCYVLVSQRASLLQAKCVGLTPACRRSCDAQRNFLRAAGNRAA